MSTLVDLHNMTSVLSDDVSLVMLFHTVINNLGYLKHKLAEHNNTNYMASNLVACHNTLPYHTTGHKTGSPANSFSTHAREGIFRGSNYTN